MTLNDYTEQGFQDQRGVKGFSIGEKGKIIFWYYDPTKNVYYRIFVVDKDDYLICRRYVVGEIEIKVHFD
jgi:hypothetical protein